jgi:hypothetical protein
MLKTTTKAKVSQQALVKWASVPLLTGALATGCSSDQQDGCYLVQGDAGPIACYCATDGVAVQGTLTSQGCVEGTPAPACSNACSAATVAGLLNPDSASDNTLTSGGITIRLDLTGQSGESQVATIDVLNCDKLIGTSSIPSGGMKTFNDGKTSVTVSVGAISVGAPRSAQVQAAVVCGK